MVDIGKELQTAFDDGYKEGVAKANEWISVKDRLPEENEIVFCWKNKGGFFIGQYLGLRYTDDVYAFISVGEYVSIGTTYWQPLPQPPKGE